MITAMLIHILTTIMKITATITVIVTKRMMNTDMNTAEASRKFANSFRTAICRLG